MILINFNLKKIKKNMYMKFSVNYDVTIITVFKRKQVIWNYIYFFFYSWLENLVFIKFCEVHSYYELVIWLNMFIVKFFSFACSFLLLTLNIFVLLVSDIDYVTV